MAYQPFYGQSGTPTAPKASSGGYTSYYGLKTTSAKPKKEQDFETSSKPVAKKSEEPAPKKSKSFINKFMSGAKEFGKAAVAGEQAAATGIARTLPGGTADIEAQNKLASAEQEQTRQIVADRKAGKLTKEKAAKQLAQNQGAQKQAKQTIKDMPSKGEVAAGFGSTAADIISAGQFGAAVKAGRSGKILKAAQLAKADKAVDAIKAAKLANNASKTKKAVAVAKEITPGVAANAAAGGLNAAASGSDKEDIAKYAVAGALLPEALHYTGVAGSKLLSRKSDKAANELEKLAAEQEAKQAKTAVADLPHVEPPKDVIPTPAPTAEQLAARQKETEAAAKTAEQGQKIDKKIELLEAKKADGKFTNVDEVKVKQLKEEKTALTPELQPLAQEAERLRKEGAVESTADGVNRPASDTLLPKGVAHSDIKKSVVFGSSVKEGGKSHDIDVALVLPEDHPLIKEHGPINPGYLKVGNIHYSLFGDSEAGRQALEGFSKTGRNGLPQKAIEVPNLEDVLGKAKPNAVNSSRVYERLRAEHPNELGDTVNYEAINLKDQADKATELMSKDRQAAYRIAMGQEESSDLTSTAANIALAEKALEEGNTNLYSNLIRNRSLAQTRRGQELVSEKASITDNSTSRYVKELIGMRMQQLGSRHTYGINLSKSNAKKAATDIVDKQVKEIGLKIRKKQLDTKTALGLLDKMECI